MPCEHYKDALMEAAASGAVLPGELRAHLAACSFCREAFAQDQSLFSAIDAGLQAAANAEVPPSLLPRVRASLDEVAAPRFRWVQPLVFVSASAALVLVFSLMVRPHRATPENVAKQRPANPAPSAPATSKNPGKASSVDNQVASATVTRPHTTRNSTNPHSAASSNPEVLVPPDEREAFGHFIAALNERGDVANGLLTQAAGKKDVLLSVDRLQIADIEIKPLEGGETETSKDAGEKR